MNIELPYGKEKLSFEIPEDRLKGILIAKAGKTGASVPEAMRNPAGPPLYKLAEGKKTVTIIASDHTRPVPSKIIMPLMLREIRQGNPHADITILVATGCHRGTSKEELQAKFGDDIVNSERIIVHDCDDTENLVNIGTLPSGGQCVINKLAVDCDLLVAEGFIEPHFFAGFSGGRKSVLPGVAARQTVLANHCSEFIASPLAVTGVLDGNPIHADMLWAARKAGLKYIVNVVLDDNKNIRAAFAGDPVIAHAAGCRFITDCCCTEPAPADIVITSNGGYPLDQNVYQAVKGMTAAEATVSPGGVIIMLARSQDGVGGDSFLKQMSAPDINQTMQTFLSRGRNQTVPDQWQSQIFIRILQHSTVIYVSDAPDEIIKKLHMIPAHTPRKAMEIADKLTNCGTVTVIPDGVSVIINRNQ